jgi:hypothetical protein
MAGAMGAGGAVKADAAGGVDLATDVATDVAVADAEPMKDVVSDAVIDTAPIIDAIVVDTRPRDMGSDLARSLPNGGACVQSNQCTSGFCVDGICCNTSCTNPCQACTMAKTGVADGKCAAAPAMVGMKCGRACQQFPGQMLLVVVDRVCTATGACGLPQIPQAPEYCTGEDACNSVSCDQPANAYTARCVKVPKCGGNTCCCVTDQNTRSCSSKTSCTGPGKMCM